jgi:hypothetical protein
VLEDLSRRTGQFEMVATEDVSLLNRSFFTGGELAVSESQESDFLEYERSGKGLMGLHSL